MDKVRVGLLTIHDTHNYGSLLQTIGLYKALLNLGVNVTIIDYKCKAIAERESTAPLSEARSIKQVIQSLLWHNSLKKKRNSFWAYLSYNTKLTKPYDRTSISQANGLFDVFLVGSDIVWGLEITGHDMTYFLDFTEDNKRRLAFSSSVGTKWSEEASKKIKPLIDRFEQISVREQLAQDWIYDLTGKTVSVTCDPTMLLPSEYWQKQIKGIKRLPYKYVFVYMSVGNTTIDDAKEYAKKYDLKVVFLNYYLHKKEVKNLKANTINEWLALIANAEAVFTASYHGLLFSLYYHKNVFYYNRGNTSRMISLSNELKITHREGNEKNLEQNIPIDYEFVDSIMERKRQYSWSILKGYFKV